MLLHGLPDALSVRVSDGQEQQALGVHGFAFGQQAQAGFLPGAPQASTADFFAARVVGHRFDGTAGVSDLEGHAAFPELFSSHRFPVDQQFNLRCPGINLNLRGLAVAALPGPALVRFGQNPAVQLQLFPLINGPHGDVRARFPFQRHAGVGCLGLWLSTDIDSASAAKHRQADLVVQVLRRTVAALADVLNARPHEITDDARIVPGDLPEAVSILTEGFAAQDQPLGVLPEILLISEQAVVVAGDIHIGVGVAGLHIAAMQRSAKLHEVVAHPGGQRIVEITAHMLLFCRLRSRLFLFFGLVVAVHAKANGIQEVEEDIDAAAHGARGIQAVEVIGHLLRERDALLLAGLRDLIAGGIHDDAGMIIILLHHLPQVVLPPVLQVQNIVILCLVDVPHVHVLVHHQHAQPVAGIQYGLRAGIVRRAQGVVAIFLQDAHLALLSLRERARAQHPVIVVDARAAQDDPLAVDGHAIVYIPFELAYAEGFLHNIGPEGRPTGVQVGLLAAP